MRLHDGLTNGQSQAGAVGFCGEKGLEQLFGLFGAEAGPIIVDGDLDAIDGV